MCDGVENCSDKSDESPELCVGTICLEGTFRCAYGACISKTALCNHVTDCRDGSDEIASICSKDFNMSWYTNLWQKQDIPDTIDTTTIRISHENEKSCKVIGANVHLKTMYNGLPYLGEGTVPHMTTVRLSCGFNFVRQGSDVNTCDNGEWMAPWIECIKGCKSSTITNDRSIQAVCTYEDEIVDCSTLLHLPKTIATTKCAQGYKHTEAIAQGEVECKVGGFWRRRNAVSVKLKCIPDCGRTFDTVKGDPWVVSVFKRMGPDRHNFQCLGTIINPSYVLTVTSCFQHMRGITEYSIIMGNHTNSFNPNREHGYDVRHISTIISKL